MSRVRAAEPVRMASPTPPDLKGLQYLSQEERNARRPTLPPGEGFWVFGYGSLMWHPGFPHVEVRPARLRGLHRSFCVYSPRYRGTPPADRKSVVEGQRVSVRVDPDGRRTIKKKKRQPYEI